MSISEDALPEGWIAVSSNSRPGEMTYKHEQTGKRIKYHPGHPAAARHLKKIAKLTPERGVDKSAEVPIVEMTDNPMRPVEGPASPLTPLSGVSRDSDDAMFDGSDANGDEDGQRSAAPEKRKAKNRRRKKDAWAVGSAVNQAKGAAIDQVKDAATARFEELKDNAVDQAKDAAAAAFGGPMGDLLNQVEVGGVNDDDDEEEDDDDDDDDDEDDEEEEEKEEEDEEDEEDEDEDDDDEERTENNEVKEINNACNEAKKGKEIHESGEYFYEE
jgi:hypothetical protein